MPTPALLTLYQLYRHAPRPVRAIVDTVYRIVPERFLRTAHMREILSEIERTQWLPPDVLEALQMDRLRALLAHASGHVPHYRELFARIGFDWRAVQSVADLSAVPILTREDVMQLGSALRSDAYPAHRMYDSATTGSTGTYLEFQRDRAYFDVEQAFTWRYLRWAGVRVHWRHAVFYRAIMTHPANDPGLPPYERYRNRLILSQFHTDDRSLRAYSAMLDDFRADYFTIFPTTLLVLTRYCREYAPRVHRPRVIICYSENLYEEHRREMEEFWGCRIHNRYGHSEGCVSAGECAEGRMHLSTEYGVAEFLREDGSPAGAGEEARLVATGLHLAAMPFIRYDTQDRAVLDGAPCPCGRGLPVVARIDGRGDDIIVSADGRRVAAYRAVYAHTHGIRLTQIVQEEPGAIIVRIVPAAGYDTGVQDLILRNIRANLGDELAVRFEIVDDVERSPSGKIRLVLSKRPPAARS